MTATGKKARRTNGNRYACKRSRRHKRIDKQFENNVLTPEQYQKIKKQK